MEISFRLPNGVMDFSSNLLWEHQQQKQQKNINQQQLHFINEFTYPSPTPALSETSSGNGFDETEENGFDQQNTDEEKKYQQLLFTGADKEKIRELLPEYVHRLIIHFRS